MEAIAETSVPVRQWKWTKRKHTAANLLARGELLDKEVAVKVGVSDKQIQRWKQSSQFADRVKLVAERIGEMASRFAIASKMRRIKALDDRWRRMQQITEERAIYHEMDDVAGGATGLLVKTLKNVGSGATAHDVDEYAVDTGLLKEMREIEKQAAQELGQWPDARKDTAAVAVNIVNQNNAAPVVDLSRLNLDELEHLRQIADRLASDAPATTDAIGNGEPVDRGEIALSIPAASLADG